jgi:hypothetical protein
MATPMELPDDIESLKALVATHLQTIESQSEKISELAHTNELLRKLVFGKKSERRPPMDADALQGSLFLRELAEQASRLAEQHKVIATVQVASHNRKKTGRRSEFPPHLPVVETISELKPEDRTCACGGELTEFGEEVQRGAQARAQEVRVRELQAGRGDSALAWQGHRQGPSWPGVPRASDRAAVRQPHALLPAGESVQS